MDPADSMYQAFAFQSATGRTTTPGPLTSLAQMLTWIKLWAG